MSTTKGGPGYGRMMRRLGPEGYAAMVADTLRLRDEYLAYAAGTRAAAPTDRGHYKEYPISNRMIKRRGK